jgi:hypothetical protein
MDFDFKSGSILDINIMVLLCGSVVLRAGLRLGGLHLETFWIVR